MTGGTIAKLRKCFKRFGAVLAIFGLVAQSTLAWAALPNDPLYERLLHWRAIGLEQAWDITTGSRDIIVAVLDSGTDINHEDLRENLWKNPNETVDGVDNDNNGHVDDVYGWDFVDHDPIPAPNPATGYSFAGIEHGTVVAGLIGAVGNNGIASAGINWQVRLMPLRILDSNGAGTTDVAAEAVAYAVSKGASVINLSLVGDQSSQTFHQAIMNAYQAGVVVVAAAGNAPKNKPAINLNLTPQYPVCAKGAGITDATIIGVAALDEFDVLAPYSNYGSNCVDISAPGDSLPSTMYRDISLDLPDTYGGSWSGTSIAAPLVSGAAALIKSLNPQFTPAQVYQFLIDGADSVRSQNVNAGDGLGAGRLNIKKSLALAQVAIAAVAPAVPPTPVAPPAPPTFTGTIATVPQTGVVAVNVFKGDGTRVRSFSTFEETFIGGATIAVGDVTGDGVPEYIVGKGPGSTPTVRIFTQEGTLVSEFLAGSANDRRGIHVAAVDVSRDGKVEVVTSPLSGEAQEISIYTAAGKPFIQFSPGERLYYFGINLAAGMVGGRPRVIVSEQQGNDQQIEAWGESGSFVNHWRLRDVPSYYPTLALADVNANGIADVLLGSAPGHDPMIFVRPFSTSNEQYSFRAFPSTYHGGVEVAATEGFIVAGSGRGSFTLVRVFDQSGTMLSEFLPYGTLNRVGVRVAIVPKIGN